jgi:hypothetical protein
VHNLALDKIVRNHLKVKAGQMAKELPLEQVNDEQVAANSQDTKEAA